MNKLLLAALAISLAFTSNVFAAKEATPNVVIVMMDNYGVGELGIYKDERGGDFRDVATPSVDQLAKEGLMLTNFNTEPQCTPSRSAFFTARHPLRTDTSSVTWGLPYGLKDNEVTMAELFKEKGYTTAMYGKWHLGDTKGRFPTDQGFDEWYGIPNTTDEALYSAQQGFDPKIASIPYILKSTKGKTPKQVKIYNEESRRSIDGELTAMSVNYIKTHANKKKPFFLFVPLTMTHLPNLPSTEFIGKTGKGNYADTVAQTDFYVGKILKAIDDADIKDNTLFIFMSENAGEGIKEWRGKNGPYRGSYFTAWEGGLRAPFVIRWPGHVKANTKSDEMMHILDVMPSLSTAVGYEIPNDRYIDGMDQKEMLFNGGKTVRDGFPVFAGKDFVAYKFRDYKIILDLQKDFQDVQRKVTLPHIYNFKLDPGETRNAVLDYAWIMPVMGKAMVKFKTSLAVPFEK